MNSRHYNLRLTDRDFRLFEYLFITKGATRAQINRDIFSNVSAPVVHERLKKLTKFNHIEGFPIWFGKSKTGYALTAEAMKSHNLFGQNLRRVELKSAQLVHDLSLVEIRNVFQKLAGTVHYLTENQLQSGLSGGKNYNYDEFTLLNCDAFLRLKIGDSGEFSGAVEFERTRKKQDRYESLFRQFYLAGHITFVFYVVGSDSLGKHLLEKDREVRGKKKPKVFIISLEKMLLSKHFLTLRNSEGAILELPFLIQSGFKSLVHQGSKSP